MNIAIIGTGYIGLVQGVVMSDLGFNVVCIDNDEVKIETLKQGKSPIYEPELEETKKFIDNSLRDGTLKTTGTDIDKLLPPVSRFGGGNRIEKKLGVIEKLKGFFDKYLGLTI